MTYKDYITTVFVIVDDVLKLLKHRHKTNKPKFSDAELITLMAFSATFRKGDIKATLKEFKENYNDIFPYVPTLSAIVKRNRKVKELVQVINIIVKNLLSNRETDIAIIDTKPIPVCKNQRMMRCQKVEGRLYKGNNGSREWFGFKLYLVIDRYGRPLAFSIMPASKHDINSLKEIINNQTVIEMLNKRILIGDKAFNSKELKEKLKEKDIELEAIKKGKVHYNHKDKQRYVRKVRKVRKVIETVFSKLQYMGIDDIKAVSLEGFITKIHFFVLALQFRICFNV